MVKHFTKEQRYTIIKCVKDCQLVGFTDKEGMKYIEDKIGKSISIMSYQRYKQQALRKDHYGSISKWLDYHAKVGHIESYKKRLEQMEMINEETLKLWHKEINKDKKDQDNNLIISLTEVLQKNTGLLMQISFTTPVMDFIRNSMIERDMKIIELNQKYQELVNEKEKDKEQNKMSQEALERYNYRKNHFIC
ncbi:MAG: hypothetical protein ACRD6U_05925 [Nitrososphaeraceae archaeon]